MFSQSSGLKSWWVCVLGGFALVFGAWYLGAFRPAGGAPGAAVTGETAKGKKEPWEGVEIVVEEDAESVRRVLVNTPAAGFDEAMLVYCGRTARVVRYDARDKADGVLRALHQDGVTHTWPLNTVRIVGSEESSSLDENHPLGVRVGETLLILKAVPAVRLMAKDILSVGWHAHMAEYCGQTGVVQRFDLTDKQAGTVRLLQKDGSTMTWPLKATIDMSVIEVEVAMHGADATWVQVKDLFRKVSHEEIQEGDEVLISDAIGDVYDANIPMSVIMRYGGRRAVVKTATRDNAILIVEEGKEVWWPYRGLRSLQLSWFDISTKDVVAVVPHCEQQVRESKLQWVKSMEKYCGAEVTIEETDKAADKLRVSVSSNDSTWFPMTALQPVLRPSLLEGSIVGISKDCASVKEMVQAITPGLWVDEMSQKCGLPGLVVPLIEASENIRQEEVVQVTHTDNHSYVWPTAVLVSPATLDLIMSEKILKTEPPSRRQVSAVPQNETAAPPVSQVVPFVGDHVKLRPFSREEGVLQLGDIGVVVDEQSSRSDPFQVKGPYGGTYWYKQNELEVVPRPKRSVPTSTGMAGNRKAATGSVQHGRGGGARQEGGRGGRGGGRGRGRGGSGGKWSPGAGVTLAVDWLSPTKRVIAKAGAPATIKEVLADGESFTIAINGEFGGTHKQVVKRFQKSELNAAS